MHFNRLFTNNKYVFQMDIIPEEIVKRIIEVELTSLVIESNIYAQFVESLVLLNDPNLIDGTVQQLIEADHVPEAGHLLLIYSGVPSSLRTFSAALAIVEEFRKH